MIAKMNLNQPSSGRRKLLLTGASVGIWFVAAQPAGAAELPDELRAAIATFTKGAPVREGRVTLEIAELVDNGNAVPVTVSVASPMTPADHVSVIALFNERNPQRDVISVQLGPHCGRAKVSTRMRLATSQKIVAVARLSDGTFWSKSTDVIVTLAACIEGET